MSSRVTIRDIASQVGVSCATVSNVLNGRSDHVSAATVARVLQAVQELNYRRNKVARGLASKSSEMLGLITTHSSWPFSAAISSAQTTAFRFGYDVLFYETNGNEDHEVQAVQSLLDRQVDGVILISSSACRGQSAIASVVAAGIPLVVINRAIDVKNGLNLLIENEGGTYAAACHLIELGHRNIGYIHLPTSGPSATAAATERLQGFRRAVNEFGLEWQSSWVRPGIGSDSKTSSDVVSFSIAQDILSRPHRPSAIICGSDFLAVGVLKAAAAMGLRVPDDVAVIGHDDSMVATYASPTLTSVRQPMKMAGTRAVETVVQHIWRGTQPSGVEKLACDLVIRESSLAPRDAQTPAV